MLNCIACLFIALFSSKDTLTLVTSNAPTYRTLSIPSTLGVYSVLPPVYFRDSDSKYVNRYVGESAILVLSYWQYSSC